MRSFGPAGQFLAMGLSAMLGNGLYAMSSGKPPTLAGWLFPIVFLVPALVLFGVERWKGVKHG